MDLTICPVCQIVVVDSDEGITCDGRVSAGFTLYVCQCLKLSTPNIQNTIRKNGFAIERIVYKQMSSQLTRY